LGGAVPLVLVARLARMRQYTTLGSLPANPDSPAVRPAGPRPVSHPPGM